ncbi:MAG: hypothetical protein EA397_13970 [Deltaproteobacteria bacterium]|nr:MAG: hypothetical protein EA397_13970 [Deltaproteobacteria bacterium]
MDKQSKLHRYSHKDYTEVVDFPVEIVGRDGVIRRYCFEDAVRLYQRRVTFAPIRYRDRDLVDAEISHCRSRIDQLRRSFFYRFGWGTPEGEPEPEQVFGDLAGEIAAFICRVLRVEGRPDVRLDPVEEGSDGVGTWYLSPRGSDQGMMLYVYRFDRQDRDTVRERFFAVLKRYEASDPEEQLLAFHHAADCGFILTAQEGHFDGLVSLQADDGIIRDVAPSNWERAVDFVRLGRYQDALRAVHEVVEAQPMDRRAYILGAVLADHLDREAELLALAQVGSMYFPSDPDLQLWLGVALSRAGQWSQAAAPLRALLASRPGAANARLALLDIYLRRGQVIDGLKLLLQPMVDDSDEAQTAHALRMVARATRLTAIVLLCGLIVQAVGVALVWIVGLAGLIVNGLGVLLMILALLGLFVEAARQLEAASFGEVAWWSRRVNKSPRLSPPLV